ncbi:MAG: hypothetical protein ACXQTR_02590 [Candidatus Methanospirareceae archaeon]
MAGVDMTMRCKNGKKKTLLVIMSIWLGLVTYLTQYEIGEKMATYEIKLRMQKRLEEVRMCITKLQNKLKSDNGNDNDKFLKLREIERLLKEKVELETALRLLGQYER